jgi:hypothetical protein
MTLKLNKYIILFVSLLISTGAMANEFSAKTSKTKVGNGETFQVSYTINTSASDFKAPAFSDFRVVGGPNHSSSMQWINGNVSQSTTYSFVLQATKEGNFTLPAASIVSGGKTIQSNTISIEVVKGQTPQANQQQHNQNQGQQRQQQASAPSTEDMSQNIFIKVSVDKTKAYIGEQITATYKIYTRVSIINTSVNKMPSLTGFWSQDLDNKNLSQVHTEVIDGIAYNVAELKKTILFPQRTGTLEIDPLALDCIIRMRSHRRPQTIQEQFFGVTEDFNYTAQSKPVKIQVMPLPDKNKPALFNGAVGKFSIEAKLDRSQVKEHEAINLALTISGKGNLQLIENPSLQIPSDIESYDPKISDKITTTANGVSGSRAYEYLLIPRHSGNFTIEPITFSYFDPAESKYYTLTTGNFDIAVEKGKAEAGSLVYTKPQEEIKMLNTDIRYIITKQPVFITVKDFFFGSLMFYILMFIPAVLLGIVAVIANRQKTLNSNLTLKKSKRANKLAEKRLSIAHKLLSQDKKKEFYEEIFKALYGYISDKFNIEVAALSKETISEEMKNRKLEDSLITDSVKTLDLCEMARFAPVTGVSGKEVYDRASNIIVRIEDEIK